MNLKSVGIMALLLVVISLMYITLGIGITTLILAIIFLIKAVLFSIKKDYHDKFLSFMNPGLYSAYNEKGNDFMRKKRRSNIICYYILSVITGFNAFIQIKLMPKIDTRPVFSLGEFLALALGFLGVVFLINYISILTMKKSKTANEDLAWNISIGIVIAIILMVFFSFHNLEYFEV